MSLFNKVKALLPDVKGVISDPEILILDRREFQISQISPSHALLTAYGVKISYSYRLYINFLEAVLAGLKGQPINVLLTEPSLTIAAYYLWLRHGDGVQVYAPKGRQKIEKQEMGIFKEAGEKFNQEVIAGEKAHIENERRGMFTFVLGNTKTAVHSSFAIDRYIEIPKGMLLLKDYGKVAAVDNREYLEENQIFPAVTLEGHGYAFKF